MFNLSLTINKEKDNRNSLVMREYKKTLEDEIDWKIIDQLHSATSNFSSASIRMKRIYAMILSLTATILLAIAKDDFIMYFVGISLVITLVFWFIDSITYYYQESLREKMNVHFNNISLRNNLPPYVGYVLEQNRGIHGRKSRSFFNHSHCIYYILFGIFILVFVIVKFFIQ